MSDASKPTNPKKIFTVEIRDELGILNRQDVEAFLETAFTGNPLPSATADLKVRNIFDPNKVKPSIISEENG